jgi:orotidine-5'-phosphate decarboxylase
MTAKTALSAKNIDPRERLIVALDVPSVEKAKLLVESLGDSARFYKAGLELFMTGDYFSFIDWLLKKNRSVFVDLKFFDIPETVQSAVRQLKNLGISFATVHGNDSILQAAVKEKGAVKILAVTVLTSLDEGDIKDLGFNKDIFGHDVAVRELVLSRAKRALAIGCDGVISSGLEAPALRDSLGENFLIVTPGIRPVKNIDDQKRTVDVEEAFNNGADYIVVGRPIRDHADPKAAADAIQETIRKTFKA